MRAVRILPVCLLVIVAATACRPSRAGGAAPDDQQHAFDFHFGTWRTHILTRSSGAPGAARWVKMTGTVTDLPLWHGRANLEKIEASGPGGRFQGLTLFLYDPKRGEWSQQFAGSSDGIMQAPVYGRFRNGRGVLYGWSGSTGSMRLERDVWSDITPRSYHFEIATSADGGKTWVTSFVAQLTRLQHSAGPHRRPRHRRRAGARLRFQHGCLEDQHTRSAEPAVRARQVARPAGHACGPARMERLGQYRPARRSTGPAATSRTWRCASTTARRASGGSISPTARRELSIPR